ncbi:hypothetical protein PV10_07310 [Exophiala mesophila]|uniref:Uncharacterized protein n=1 Tax=Exophiala mesophila TaxID=212818 RepID=A0A0D1Z573_EXOME|nr:uncharacterized protein PV10_07310 [Exophiala mesophila]KIV89957.1 hypothetical protein PV10_07310 [Exophiala mesophila]
MAEVPEKYLFVSPITSTSQPTKYRTDLIKAQARSHAARVSYPRHPKARRETWTRRPDDDSSNDAQAGIPYIAESRPTSEEPSPKVKNATNHVSSNDSKAPMNIAFRPRKPLVIKFRVHAAKRRPVKVVGASRSFVQSPKIPINISKSALDPFVRSSIELSVPDKHLLHLYLSTVPDQIYGTTTGTVSEVARNVSLNVISDNAITTMWLLLVVESQVVSFQPSRKDAQLSILTRRNQIYRSMNARLADKSSSTAEDFLLSVAIAAACEKRLGNDVLAEQHLSAVKRILLLNGGLSSIRRLKYPTGLMIINIIVENQLRSLFDTKSLLDARLAALITTTLAQIQTWNAHLRQHAQVKLQQRERNSSTSFTISNAASSSSSSHRRFISGDATSSDCLTDRARAFAPMTALHCYVRVPAESDPDSFELDDAQCRFFLGMLFTINAALYAFRSSARHTSRYLQALTRAVEMSTPANFVLRAGGSKLPSLMMLMMIAHNVVDIEGPAGFHEESDIETDTDAVFRVEEIFEFVGLIMIAGLDSRVSVIRALSSWLIFEITDSKSLSHIPLQAVVDDVRTSWTPN